MRNFFRVAKKVLIWIFSVDVPPVIYRIDSKKERQQILLAKDFSNAPEGEDEGFRFQKDFLIPRLCKTEKVTSVVLDDCLVLPSIWINAAFGTLKDRGYTEKYLKEHLEFVYKNQVYRSFEETIWKYIED